MTKQFDVVDFIMAYEGGDIDEDQIIEGFQHLISTGMIRNLQGSYQRTAQALIDAGYCERR